ncbi:MAG: hypothetical protein LUG98_06520 [Tannerellaceae bacterium]|nr:hypothetical protein [Tannerellaceae bacterium]
MAISYRVVPRKVMAGEDKGMTKYYGVPIRSKFITYKMLCRRIMIQSSATRGDVSLILQNFMDAIMEYLETGHSVQFGEAGIFRIRAGSEGVLHEDEFKASHMKAPRVNFVPSPEMRRQIATAGYERDYPKIQMVLVQPGPEEDDE